MTLSSKVVKAGQQFLSRKRVAVDIALPEVVEESFEVEITDAVSEVVERAKSEARAVLEQAEIDAQKLRQKASDEGYQEGFHKGQSEAIAEVHQAWQEMRIQLEEPLTWLRATRQYMDRLQDEATLALAAALAMALYSRLKVEKLDVVTAYVSEMVALVDSEKVAVFLDATWSSRVDALATLLNQAIPDVAVKVDTTLLKGTMRVEGAQGGLMGGPLVSLKALLSEVLE